MTNLPEIDRVYGGTKIDNMPSTPAMERDLELGEIATYSGGFYNFNEPDPNDISLADIGHALSNMCRFAGHTKRFCSVAEHSVRVAHILRAQGCGVTTQQVGLLHDAHEAYIWDCPRPLKPLLGEEFTRLALIADEAVFIAVFTELSARPALEQLATDARIKEADDIALVYEATELMSGGVEHWSERYHDVGPLPAGLDYVPPGVAPIVAKGMFLNECQELGLL